MLVWIVATGCGDGGNGGASSDADQARRCEAACNLTTCVGAPDADKQSCQTVCLGTIAGLTAVCAQCVVSQKANDACAHPVFLSPASSECAAVCVPTPDAGQ